MKTKRSSERSLALLLGGCLYDESTKIRVLNKRARQQVHTKEEIKRDTFLWSKDFQAAQSFFEEKGIEVWKSIPTQNFATKAESADLIKKFFELEKRRKGRVNLVIYWCGHGEPGTGSWCFSEDGDISFEEIMQWWSDSIRMEQEDDVPEIDENEFIYRMEPINNRYLTIIADTCHSGSWIPKLKELSQAENNLNVAIQAACRPEEEAWIENLGAVPRSLLLRKFMYDHQQEKQMKSQKDNKCNNNNCTIADLEMKEFVWVYSRQHPEFYCSYKTEDDIFVSSSGEKYCTVQGLLRFSTIEQHWIIEGGYHNQKAILNGVTRKGQFMKDF